MMLGMLAKDLIETTGIVLLLGYLAFIPTGPFPIPVAVGLNLDVIIGFLLFLFVVTYSLRIGLYPHVFVLAWLFYLLVVFLSAIFSDNFNHSIKYAFIIFGYSAVALLVPVIFVNHASFLRKWLFTVATIVSSIIIYLYVFHGFADGHRFALGVSDMSRDMAMSAGLVAIDPNMTAAGLLLSMIVYFPYLFDDYKRLLLDLFGVTSILLGSVILLSRSAMIGFILSIFISYCILLVKRFDFDNVIVFNKKLLVAFPVFIISIPLVVIIGNALFPEIIDSFLGRILRIADDSHRIDLLVHSWGVFISDIKTILIGGGLMTVNPHNEYLRVLASMGTLGWIGSFLFLLFMFYFSTKSLSGNHRAIFSAWTIIVFVLVISMFYGYTKLVWVAWMFLLLLHHEYKFDCIVQRVKRAKTH